MEPIVSLKTLRQNMTKYAKAVKQGKSFIVFKRSRPLFRIAPVDEAGWKTVIDFTAFRKDGIPAEELIERLKRMK